MPYATFRNADDPVKLDLYERLKVSETFNDDVAGLEHLLRHPRRAALFAYLEGLAVADESHNCQYDVVWVSRPTYV